MLRSQNKIEILLHYRLYLKRLGREEDCLRQTQLICYICHGQHEMMLHSVNSIQKRAPVVEKIVAFEKKGM